VECKKTYIMEEELRKKIKELEQSLETCNEEQAQSIEFALAEMYDFYNILIIKGLIIPNPKLK
jgi:hypothetical protein